MRNKKAIWGIVCLALAVVVFLNSIGLFKVSFIPGVSTMKLVITVIVAYILLKSLLKFSYEGIIICCGILFKMYESLFGISVKLPVLILVMVLLILACECVFSPGMKFKYEFKVDTEGKTCSEEDGFYYIHNRFGDVTKYVNAEPFKGAVIDNAFGDVSFYFNGAIVEDGKAEIQVHNKFSDIVIYVPKNWVVKNQLRSIFGDTHEEPMTLEDGEAPEVELTVSGVSKFSDFNIRRL